MAITTSTKSVSTGISACGARRFEKSAHDPRACAWPTTTDVRTSTVSLLFAKGFSVTATNNRRAFDFARGNLWSIDPMDLCIIGGKRLPADERGPLDTDDGVEHDLYDERVGERLTEEFVNNVDAHGVDTPIIIVKLGDVATVIAGRKR